ncbi:elongation factor P [Candidatus Omnitrophota bacterium]
MVSINELKSGLTLLIDGQIYSVIDYQHVKPGKGAAFVRTKLRNLKTGNVLEKTFRGDDKIEEAFIEQKKLQYLYHSDEIYYFMDQSSFEEVGIAQDVLGANSKFLKDNIEIAAYAYEGEIFNVALPTFVELKVTHAAPGIKGDTAKAALKQVAVETGAAISVPLFIEEGDIIKVDTRSQAYVERIS